MKISRLEISLAEVTRLFKYKNGNLYWKQHRPGVTKLNKLAGSKNSRGYWQVTISGTKYKCHRLIFLMHNGYLPEHVDHKDGDKNNNFPNNLRDCTYYENNQNSRIRCDNTSGVKGVYPATPPLKGWVAAISHKGTRTYVGKFLTIEDAEIAVRAKREQLHGEFCNHGQ